MTIEVWGEHAVESRILEGEPDGITADELRRGGARVPDLEHPVALIEAGHLAGEVAGEEAGPAGHVEAPRRRQR
jgi:hypothetical protein